MPEKTMPLHVVYVEAWIKRDNTYLLAKRSSKDDQAAGRWAVPGGKVDMEVENNIIENSLKREVMEEVGVEVNNFNFIESRSFIRSSGHHVVGMSFTADYVSGEAQPLDDQDEIKWATLEEAKSLMDEFYQGILEKLK